MFICVSIKLSAACIQPLWPLSYDEMVQDNLKHVRVSPLAGAGTRMPAMLQIFATPVAWHYSYVK
jgi:hypothetical protein